MGVFRRHRWRRYVEGSHSSLVATDHLAARCIASRESLLADEPTSEGASLGQFETITDTFPLNFK
jgi:hypothetical protein